MRPKAQTLFHFTPDVQTLKDILLGGFWPRYSVEDFRWQAVGSNSVDFAAIPMVCFCDIPLSRIEEHVEYYGRYGIGLSRAWGEQKGLNPLLYIASENTLSRALILLAEVSRDQCTDNAALADVYIKHAASFMKPVSGQTTTRAGLKNEKDFYQESEWRYVPSHGEIPPLLLPHDFEDSARLTEANAKTKEFASLQFLPADIRYIFVRCDDEIPDLINFIQTSMDKYSAFDTKVLMSRVTSLETLHQDW
jgi:hypothetical protein